LDRFLRDQFQHRHDDPAPAFHPAEHRPFILRSGAALPVFQTLAYGIFAFGRDLMLALILGGAMLLVSASQRGSLNAMLNAVYQTGATAGGLAGAWLYGFRADFTANAVVSSVIFAASALMLWSITKLKDPMIPLIARTCPPASPRRDPRAQLPRDT
jgi:MFS family permease